MNDITPAAPIVRQLIQGYGANNFRIAGETHRGSVIIFPETTISWDIAAYDDITVASFADLADAADDIDVLLIGCGARMGMPRADIRDYLKEIGIVLVEIPEPPAGRSTYCWRKTEPCLQP